MVRLERQRAGRSEWLELWVEGCVLWQHGGGSLGSYRMDSPEAAQAELETIVKRKRKQSFKIVPVAAEEPSRPARAASNPDLEKAIDAAPDDVRGYQVYGDWLQSQGDPRGELIALQTRDRPDEELVTRFVVRHGALLAGPIAKADGNDPRFVRYRWGFVERLTVLHDPARTRAERIDVTREVLTCTAARFLRNLDLPGPMEGDELGDIARALAGRVRPTVVRLWTRDGASGSLDGLCRVFPGVEDLCVSGPVSASRLELPALRSLILESSGLLPAVLSSPLEKLESLSIGLPQAAEVRELLSRAPFPALTALGLAALPDDDSLVDAILMSPLLPRLRKLVFPWEWLTPGRLDALLRRPEALSHLERLHVGGLAVSSARVKEIQGMGVKLDGVRPAPARRRRRRPGR